MSGSCQSLLARDFKEEGAPRQSNSGMDNNLEPNDDDDNDDEQYVDDDKFDLEQQLKQQQHLGTQHTQQSG